LIYTFTIFIINKEYNKVPEPSQGGCCHNGSSIKTPPNASTRSLRNMQTSTHQMRSATTNMQNMRINRTWLRRIFKWCALDVRKWTFNS